MNVRLLVLTAAGVLLPATVADASTLSMGAISPMLFFHAGSGERNRVEVRLISNGVEVRDSGSTIVAGAGCEGVGPHRVRCASGSFSPPRLRANLGDEDDVLRLVDGEPGTTAIGGPGDDVLTGADDPDRLFGGPGRDVLSGRWGGDELSGGPGDDVIRGGGDADTVTYASHTRRVSVDLTRGIADGPGGELDQIAGVEHVTGGSGDDRLAGDESDNRLDGGAGRDRLIGRAGDDEFARGAGGVACGEGRDDVRAWSLDPIQYLDPSCEWVDASSTRLPAQPDVVRRRWVGWRVTCPRETPESFPEQCAPTIRLSEAGGRTRTLAEVTLEVAPWSDHLVRLDLNGLGRRLLRSTPRPRVTVEVTIPESVSGHWQVRLR